MSLIIERINSKLEGEFTFRGKKWSVPFTVTGDQVQFKLKRKGRKLSLEILFIEENQKERENLPLTRPFCPHFSECGGCRGQHLSYEFQLKLKTSSILESMEKEIGIQPETISAPALQGHRHRMDFAVDGTACGLRPAGNFSKIIDIENCPVQSDRANTILNLFRKVLKQFDSAGYRRENGTGIIKYATIRSGKTGSLILTCDRENLENDSSCVFHDFSQVLIQEIQNNSSENFSLIICTTERNSDLSCTPGGKVIYGSETFTIEMGGLQFQTPYDAFFQPNPECFQLLLEKSSEAILQNHDLLTEGNLLDLYSGSGILSAVLLEKLQPVLKNKIKNIKGYDFTDSAVNNAEKNFASFQGFLSFHSADLNKKFSDDESPFRDPVSLMIADPPRAGISPNLLKNIVESSEAPLFLYISCNPESQIRDLKKLIEKYTPVKAWIADCFPHTGHLEQAVLLKLKD